jgi:hypothetical protein
MIGTAEQAYIVVRRRTVGAAAKLTINWLVHAAGAQADQSDADD